jgi:hypothetical protein
MTRRTTTPTQPPLPPFKREVDASVLAHLEILRIRQERNRELARERSRRFRARKADKA